MKFRTSRKLSKRLSVVVCLVVGIGSTSSEMLGAQIGSSRKGPNPEQIEEELDRTRRSFAESESRLQRLHELRIRLAFGLGVEADRYFRLAESERGMSREAGNQKLVTEESELERLSLQASALSEQIDGARRSVPGPMSDGSDLAEMGSIMHRLDVSRADAPPREPDSIPVGRTESSAIPKGESVPPFAPSATPDDPADVETPVSRVIAGTSDHAAVGRVLVHAGDSLMRRASEESDPERAATLRDRALKSFAQAKLEFEPLTKMEKPALADLYYLARCEEKLGNAAAADSFYAQIISVDVKNGPDGEVFGRWARAAQSAKSVLRWVEDRGGWKPVRNVDDIRWGLIAHGTRLHHV